MGKRKAAAEKGNGDAAIVKVAETTGGSFDGLGFGIEALGAGVGEMVAMNDVGKGLKALENVPARRFIGGRALF